MRQGIWISTQISSCRSCYPHILERWIYYKSHGLSNPGFSMCRQPWGMSRYRRSCLKLWFTFLNANGEQHGDNVENDGVDKANMIWCVCVCIGGGRYSGWWNQSRAKCANKSKSIGRSSAFPGKPFQTCDNELKVENHSNGGKWNIYKVMKTHPDAKFKKAAWTVRIFPNVHSMKYWLWHFDWLKFYRWQS